MSVHETHEAGMAFEVRWADFFLPEHENFRRFRDKASAEAFDRRVEAEWAKVRANDGAISVPVIEFDPGHPLAVEAVMDCVSELLEHVYPDHSFTLMPPGRHGDELPLESGFGWEGETREEHERETADLRARFEELGRRHPELLGEDGEIDYGREVALHAAMDAEPDLFARSAYGEAA